ncbi:hypothetical protein HDV06_006122 [Boothiomyces sp. JEL0866]|nr:hypothetical protein HDV06_006122 [Boothiomyces sp. JEL0866]
MKFALHIPRPIKILQNIPQLVNTDLNTTISTLKYQKINNLVSILPTRILEQDILNALSCRSTLKSTNPSLIPLHKTCGYPIMEYKFYFSENDLESPATKIVEFFSNENRKNPLKIDLEQLQLAVLNHNIPQDKAQNNPLEIFNLIQDSSYLTKELNTQLKEIIARDVVFNPTLGCVYFFPNDWAKDEYIFHRIMPRLLAYIYPQLHSFQTIEILRQAIVKYRNFKITSKNKVALCPPFRNRCWTLCREPFNGALKKKLTVKGENTLVWDNRYLITSKHTNYTVKPLTCEGLRQITKKLPREIGRNVEKIVNSLPPPTRELLPCIDMHGEIVSIPTLGVNLKDEFQAQYIPHLENEILDSNQ